MNKKKEEDRKVKITALVEPFQKERLESISNDGTGNFSKLLREVIDFFLLNKKN